MANFPLIPAAQKTFSRFKRKGKKSHVDFDGHTDDKHRHPKQLIKRRLADRRKLILRVRLDRRANQDRRNLTSTNVNANISGNSSGKGRHINTTA